MTAVRNQRNDPAFSYGGTVAPLRALLLLVSLGCDGAHSKSGAVPSTAPTVSTAPRVDALAASAVAVPSPATPAVPAKVEVQDEAMGTSLHFIAYTSPEADEAATRAAIGKAISEMRRLENLLSEWKPQSEIGQVNAHAGEWVGIGPEATRVIERGLWAGKLSAGSFDITFQSLSQVWKFGSAAEDKPKLPSRAEVEKLRRRVDYRRVELDEAGKRVRIGKDQQLGLGGIAKGYIVDQASKTLRDAGVRSFLAQAGGDLFGSGRKPDGSPWVSGVQDPRGPQGEFFAVLELTDHAFSTAGDYARAYVVGGKRYHHIIDPKTGYPATACRSVTVWAPDATTADGVDDAVFILGPEQGLKLVESLDGVGAVIVDAKNRVIVSERVKDKVRILRSPTDAL
ncbi:MAG TPA: FAD:protein FMN transferase [Polyangiaceae bacterium]|nr:FAD:protein FMN transferase [Polyangiaceae bacterium]